MSKFIIMMLRDKEANGATYSLPSSLISSNLDPELHAKLTAIDHKIYSSVEEAESSARDIAKQIFIYDHTKRPRVLKDFRLYRWWVLDVEKPIETLWGNGKYDIDTIEHALSTTGRSLSWFAGLKTAIVKKGKIDFSKEKDPSNGAIAKRAKDANDQFENELKERQANPKTHISCYFDEPHPLTHASNEDALDSISYTSKWIKNFHKDSLNLLSEYCFIYPTKGCYYTDYTANMIGITPRSRKKVWACSVSRCIYEKEAEWKKNCSEMYRASVKVFASKEEAILHAALLGFQQPQVFDDFSLPDHVKMLLGYIEGVGGHYVFPAEVYRTMVIDGTMPPIKKFMKKKVA